MNAPPFHRYRLPALMLAAMTGCTAMSTPPDLRFDPQQTAQRAQQQLAGLLPPGTPLPQARRDLSAQGFDCKDAAAGQGALLCTLQPPPAAATPPVAAAPTPVTWLLTVDSSDGQSVAGLRIQRFPPDLGH